jgi:type VI secretion system protein VasJ
MSTSAPSESMSTSTFPVDERLLSAIPGAAPAGADLSYDPELERISAELEKLASIEGGLPDWSLVEAESARLLRERSKDLRLMSWWVAGRAHTAGWSALGTALSTYLELARAYWPTLYPPPSRVRARAGQVEWLWNALGKRIAQLSPQAGDASNVRALEPLVASLASFFAEQLKGADPGISQIRTALREKIRALPEPIAAPAAVPAPVPVEETSEPSPETSREPASDSPALLPPPHLAGAPRALPPLPSLPSTPARSGSSNGVAGRPPAAAPPPEIAVAAVDASSLAGLEQTQDAARPLRDPLTTLAHHARKHAPESPWGYRMLRTALWLTVEQAPFAEGGKTPLRGPKAQDRELLERLAQSSQWDALLEASEDAAGTHVFWLDPHRYSALALENKGPAFAAARRALVREVSALVERVPGLTALTFSNGTPFATAVTTDWLAAELAAFSGGARESRESPGEDEEAAALAELERTPRDVRDARLDEALAVALGASRRLTSPRARFKITLAVAKRARAAERHDLALALYEQLAASVDDTLSAWEPALCAEALNGLLGALTSLSTKSPPTARADATSPSPGSGAAPLELRCQGLFRRLLALDPRTALLARKASI